MKPDEKEIEARIAEMLSSDPEDFDEIEEYIDEVSEYYSGDLEEFTFRKAVQTGARNYVDAYADDIDLNDGSDGNSTYIDETDDPDMQSLLMSHGAYRSWDDYLDHRFAVETLDWNILAFDSDFQEEVFEKYLEYTGLTREKVKEMLSADYDIDEDDDLPEGFDRDFDEDMDAIGVTLEEGEITFTDKEGDDGSATQDLLEELGWSCSFEGESWKLETNGVYFID